MYQPSRPDRGQPKPEADEPSTPEREVLEEVLRQTLSEQSGEEDADDVRLLIGVARLHPNTASLTETIVRELIATLLQAKFPTLVATPAFRESVAGEIAVTLMEDPHQTELLKRLWSKLSDRAA